MAQSYDVYFARMILTLGLVEREAIQAALGAYQQSGGGVGFPKWLVEHQLLDKGKVKKVADELEKWFTAARARSESEEDRAPLGIEDEPAATEEPATPPSDEGSSELEIPPDESGVKTVVPARPAPVKPAAPAGASSRPSIPIPADRPPTPRAQPRNVVERKEPPVVVSKGGTPPVAAPRPTPAQHAQPPASAPPPKVARESQRLKKPSARLKKPDEGSAPPPAKAPSATSGRVVKPNSARMSGERGAEPRASEKVVAEPGKPVSADKQWALFDKATKDPLSRLIGERLGRTEVVKLLATAEIVTTFEGRHGDDERAALVKVLRPEKIKDKVALERFTREAQALAKIDHPNIARILESGVAEGVRYISMEVGSGEPLSETLGRVGRLPPERVARMGRGVALGLAAAHRAGIIHRDLRPANVLVEEGGTVKLIGFGIARDVSVPGRLTATGHITGHPSYVAPEVAQSLEITPKVDVYSLGIVLYLALAGRLPFESRSVVKLVGLHLNAPPPKLADVVKGCPPKLASLVERCLAKDPEKRPDAMEVANGLAAKDLLEGFDAQKWSDEAKKPDTEEELRRAMATDEQPAVDASAENNLGGPACAACELPLGLKSTSLHGNQICSKCVERVEALELCAACLLEIEEKDAGGTEVAVFAGHIYCRSCTRRVRLPCALCRKEAALSGLANGQTKAKGDQLTHAVCPK